MWRWLAITFAAWAWTGAGIGSLVAAEPARPATDLYELVDPDPRSNYEVRDVLACLLDGGSFDEYKAEFGQTLVCGTARVGELHVRGRSKGPLPIV